jgi:hypothetical protein
MTGYRSAIFMILCGVLVLAAAGGGCSMNSVGPPKDDGIDVVNFTIDDVGVAAITDSSAYISWSTSENAVSTLTLAITPSFEPSQRFSTPIGYSHQLQMGSLAPSTTYYYKINAAEIERGDTTSVTGKSFVTEIDSETLDTTPPLITEIEVINITSQSATITWVTDDRCYGEVFYGREAATEYSAVESFDPPHTHSRVHSVQLLNLDHSTAYIFAIEAVNVANRQTTSAAQSFTTSGMPQISFCPPTMVLAPQQEFDLTVCVSGVQDMGAVSIAVQVDASKIELLGNPKPVDEDHGGLSDVSLPYQMHFYTSSYNRLDGIALFEATWIIEMEGDLMLGTGADAGGSTAVCTIPCRLRENATTSDVRFRTQEFDGEAPVTFIRDYLRYEVTTAENGTCTITIGTE